MSAALPEKVDATRAVSVGRRFEGSVALRQLPRLGDALAGTEGVIDYRIEFGRDALGIAYLDLKLTGELPLVCQRTLEIFGWPLRLSQRLGLVRRESDEASLPEGYEALLLVDGQVEPLEVVQDEALLALPLIPARPGTEERSEWIDDAPVDAGSVEALEGEAGKAVSEHVVSHPFAALAGLRPRQNRTSGD